MSRASAYNEKRRKAAEAAIEKELDTGCEKIDFDGMLANDTKDSAMGKGEEELFEKKLTKEEKKALAKAKREAKKKDKPAKKGSKSNLQDLAEEEKKEDDVTGDMAKLGIDPDTEEGKLELALENLSKQNIVVTYEQRKGNLHANTRDINVSGVSVAFHGKLLIEETDLVINYGNRYGFIGPNGSGKVRNLFVRKTTHHFSIHHLTNWIITILVYNHEGNCCQVHPYSISS